MSETNTTGGTLHAPLPFVPSDDELIAEKADQRKKAHGPRRKNLGGRKGTSLPESVIQAQLAELQSTFKGALGVSSFSNSIPEVDAKRENGEVSEATDGREPQGGSVKKRKNKAEKQKSDIGPPRQLPPGDVGSQSEEPPRVSQGGFGLPKFQPRARRTQGQGTTGMRRMSSSVVFREGYEISPDIDEMVKSALAKNKSGKFTDEKYTRAAVCIQTYYRRYRLRKQFQRVKQGTGVGRALVPVHSVGGTPKEGLPVPAVGASDQNQKHASFPSAPTARASSRRASGPNKAYSLNTIEAEILSEKLAALKVGTPDQRDRPNRKPESDDRMVAQPINEDSSEERSRLMRLGIHKFNRQAKNGIQFLISKGLIDGSPAGVAEFLSGATNPECKISKTVVGEYLGDPASFNLEVLSQLTRSVDFKGMPFDEALRHYLSHFRLPGEAQKIDRMMEAFAKRYYEANSKSPASEISQSEKSDSTSQNSQNSEVKTPSSTANYTGIFTDSDAIYILAYACIMLNTDAHNPNVKHKMSREDFIRNTRGINGGGDLPREYLTALYDSIIKTQFMTTDAHTVEVRSICSKLMGLPQTQDMSPPWRYFVGEVELEQVTSFVARAPGSHPRRLFLFNDVLIVTKPRKGTCHVKQVVSLFGLSVLSVRSHLFRKAYQLHYGEQNQKLGAFAPGAGDKGGSKMEKFMAVLQDYVDEARGLEVARRQQVLAKSTASSGAPPESRGTESLATSPVRRPVPMEPIYSQSLPVTTVTTSTAVPTSSPTRSRNSSMTPPVSKEHSDWGALPAVDGNTGGAESDSAVLPNPAKSGSVGATASLKSLALRGSIKRSGSKKPGKSKGKVVDLEKVLAPTRLPGTKSNIENIPGISTPNVLVTSPGARSSTTTTHEHSSPGGGEGCGYSNATSMVSVGVGGSNGGGEISGTTLLSMASAENSPIAGGGNGGGGAAGTQSDQLGPRNLENSISGGSISGNTGGGSGGSSSPAFAERLSSGWRNTLRFLRGSTAKGTQPARPRGKSLGSFHTVGGHSLPREQDKPRTSQVLTAILDSPIRPRGSRGRADVGGSNPQSSVDDMDVR